MAFSSFNMLTSNLKALLLVLTIIHSLIGVSQGQLQVGFYSQSCPTAESIVHQVVQKAVVKDPGNAAVLLRLIFHDCFVEGCDGSILIDGEKSEKRAFGNQGVQGFDIIDKAKASLEGVCPGVVSCADIVALAARDAVSLGAWAKSQQQIISGYRPTEAYCGFVKLMSGPYYDVPTGRRDGRVSNMELVANIPEVDDSIQLLKSKFMDKGLSDEDLVLLTAGGHTIGSTACFFMQKRLYNFNTNGGSDQAIDPQFLPILKAKCPPTEVNPRISLDPVTEFIFDDQSFRNIRNGLAVIASDARLYDDKNTKKILDSYTDLKSYIFGPSFKADFANAMLKMCNIGVKTGSEGEIRRVCSAVN